MYYLGNGVEFIKENCKEYKTKDGALKAMKKVENGVVWDETGQVIDRNVAIDGVATESLENNLDDNMNVDDKSAYHEDANVAAAIRKDDCGQQENVTIIQGNMKATVVCNGTLNIRRTPAWGNDNICGRATKGQSYYVKEIHTVEGKKMLRTIDNLYLSGQPEHIKLEQL